MICFQTILDPQDVFSEIPEMQLRNISEKRLENGMVYGVKSKEGFRVERLFSTNPQDYLNPKYQFGNILY